MTTTAPPEGQSSPSLQVDMGRVLQRATAAAGASIGDMAAELGMARELADLCSTRATQAEQRATELEAELGRARVTIDRLQARNDELEGTAGRNDGDAGRLPEGAPGEG